MKLSDISLIPINSKCSQTQKTLIQDIGKIALQMVRHISGKFKRNKTRTFMNSVQL